MLRTLTFCGGLSLLWIPAVLEAQNDVILQLYGQAVHDYFAGNYRAAQQTLTEVLDSGSRDPRAYYFRGLAQHQLGQADAGDEDFRVGAELEARSGAEELVGRALTRVQGSERLQLEEYRTAARVALFQQREQMRRARFGDTPPRGPERFEPAGEAMPPADAATAEDEIPAFGEEPAEATENLFGESVEEPAAADEEEPPAEPAADDPFGDETAPPEAEPAGEDQPAGEEEGDPFGDDAEQPDDEAEDDPFA